MADDWYIRVNNADRGPLSSRTLKQLAVAGIFTPETLLKKGSSGHWSLASHVKGLFPQVAEQAVPQTFPSAPRAKPAMPLPAVPPQVSRDPPPLPQVLPSPQDIGTSASATSERHLDLPEQIPPGPANSPRLNAALRWLCRFAGAIRHFFARECQPKVVFLLIVIVAVLAGLFWPVADFDAPIVGRTALIFNLFARGDFVLSPRHCRPSKRSSIQGRNPYFEFFPGLELDRVGSRLSLGDVPSRAGNRRAYRRTASRRR